MLRLALAVVLHANRKDRRCMVESKHRWKGPSLLVLRAPLGLVALDAKTLLFFGQNLVPGSVWLQP